MIIDISIDQDIYLPCYRHLLEPERFDIDFLYGGRDSGKSRQVGMQLIEECLSASYFKNLMIRKVLNTVRDSQFSLIKSIIEEWGMLDLFKINESRMEIVCKANGNGFFGRGLDDVGRIKSFNNPSSCWIEEGNQIEATDLVVVLTSLRTNNGTIVKTYFTFNPECDVNYTDFWLYQDYFEHTESLSWTWVKSIEVPIEAALTWPKRVYERDGKYWIDYNIRATHTTYKDNPYCDPTRIALYESYKNSKNNAYWYQTYTLGLWGFRRTGGGFWKCFDETVHVLDLPLTPVPIHISVDNNVMPYITITIWQLDMIGKWVKQVKELMCEHPYNTATKSAAELVKWLQRIDYQDVVFIYGDPSANSRTTVDDDGKSFFDKFISELQKSFRVTNRIKKSHSRVAILGEFINEVYESNFMGWHIGIDTNCRKSIEDYSMVKEDSDGTILKKRVTDKETKQSYEKYGHASDSKKDFISVILEKEFITFTNRRGKPQAKLPYVGTPYVDPAYNLIR